jgi:hypothetical protein
VLTGAMSFRQSLACFVFVETTQVGSKCMEKISRITNVSTIKKYSETTPSDVGVSSFFILNC